MKKVILVLLAGMLMAPLEMFADKYNCKKVGVASRPVRMPARYFISLDVDETSGDLYVTPNYDLTGLTITLTGGGATYINTTVSLTAGQSYTDTLAGYDEGTYILTLSTADGVIAQYEITVEAD